jgi:hypothetical protein
MREHHREEESLKMRLVEENAGLGSRLNVDVREKERRKRKARSYRGWLRNECESKAKGRRKPC